jgi:hypothetical protein
VLSVSGAGIFISFLLSAGILPSLEPKTRFQHPGIQIEGNNLHFFILSHPKNRVELPDWFP